MSPARPTLGLVWGFLPLAAQATAFNPRSDRRKRNRHYTGFVFRALVSGVWVGVLVTSAAMACVAQTAPAAPSPAAKSSQPPLATGVILPQQVTAAKPDQSYALYLPSHYTPAKRWPIIYAFDPDARGSVPVELMKDAAERYGYIVLGSNNSRNGSWKVESEAAQAMWDDTHARLAIDDRRVYFAGFSGGARVASALAQACKCAAGVLLSGAGFSSSAPPATVGFAVFAAVGSFDFNYPELSDLDEKLEHAGSPHVLRHFDGPHQWAPAAVMDEALAWFRLIAMKQGPEARDDSFVALQKSQAVARAHALEQAEPYEAWREYREAIATFAGLADTAALEQAASTLALQKAVRDGANREKQEFREQTQLAAGIYAGLAALRGGARSRPESSPATEQPSAGAQQHPSLPGLSGDDGSPSDLFSRTRQQIVELRQRAASEKKPDKMRVYRRALSGVFIGAVEAGEGSLDAKSYSLAAEYFQLASDANPESGGVLQALARAEALANDRKAALQALHRAREKSKDLPAFSAWLNQEPAFAKLREDPQFRALVATP